MGTTSIPPLTSVFPRSIPLRTLADLMERFGGISLERIRFQPAPGTATIQDLLTASKKEHRLFELVEGVLVEKVMGYSESLLAAYLLTLLHQFVRANNLGYVTGPDATMELMENLVRLPDVAYLSWDRLPGRRLPADAVPRVVPDLAVEVLSPSNTPGEMSVKRGEYFEAGVTLVWEVDPRGRTVRVYTSPTQVNALGVGDTLLGDPVLPGFALPLDELFGELDRQG